MNVYLFLGFFFLAVDLFTDTQEPVGVAAVVCFAASYIITEIRELRNK